MANVHLFNDMSIGGIEREYIEVFKPSIGEVKTEFKPTDIVRIGGNRYRMVDRKAEVGEKVLAIYTGEVLSVKRVYSELVRVDEQEEVSGETRIYHKNYHVLEPVADDNPTVDGRHASPEVVDLLANLARRVTSLEQQLRDTQGNVEKLAEELESVRYGNDELCGRLAHVEADVDDLTPKSPAKLLAEAFDALAKYERGGGRA